MDVDWFCQRNILKKEGIKYEVWNIWWTICPTRSKRKIR